MPNIVTMTLQLLDTATLRYNELHAAAASAPAEFERFQSSLGIMVSSGDGIRAFTYVLLFLIVGVGGEAFYWTYAYASLRTLRVIKPTSPHNALLINLRIVLISSFGIVLFAFFALISAAAFSWPSGVESVAVNLIFSITAMRMMKLLVLSVLAPTHRILRLVPASDLVARRSSLVLLAMAFLLAFIHLTGSTLPLMRDERHLVDVVNAILGTLLALGGMVGLLAFRQPLPPRRGARQPRFPKIVLAVALILCVYLLWLFGNPTPAMLLATIGMTSAVQLHLRDFVFYFWRKNIDTEAPARDPDNGPDEKLPATASLMPSIILPAVRLLVVGLALVVCAASVDVSIFNLATSNDPVSRFAFDLLVVAALCLLANVAWVAVKTTIDVHLQRADREGSDGKPLKSARLLTLLPILRTAAAVAISVMLALSCLWTLGFQITPLLAGAGVVGLAFGFGAQSLVKDLITGIFYLAEDTFRVGEYIESGSSTKGTVERLTLRTVALRHHNGPLFFVPYGSLGTVRNTSRDWVIEKFNLPMPMEIDSEKVRKLIKKIGQEMLNDEELAGKIMQPLKGKLYKVEPGLKIFRCSFQTAPGNQFDVRAAAYKRIEAALQEAGLAFAGNPFSTKNPYAVGPVG